MPNYSAQDLRWLNCCD
uniref:Uncharacterized protein n=1 Tax=Arundo donax TaxID=35708 RepID=A0A0A9B3F5_ARUDO